MIEGKLRLVRGQVIRITGGVRPGLLVQEFGEDNDRAAWRTVCPLTDAEFMLPLCPTRWMRASITLRNMIERGEAVTLADEMAALVAA